NNMPIVTYRSDIYKVLAENQETISDAAVDEAQLEAAILSVVKKGAIANQLIMMMDFFDGLVFCVSKHICDPETALDLFYSRSRELYTTFYQYIHLQRRNTSSSDFGLGLQTFAEMKDKKKPTTRAGSK